MIGIIRYEQARYTDAIMYLSKVSEKYDGNLFKVQLPEC